MSSVLPLPMQRTSPPIDTARPNQARAQKNNFLSKILGSHLSHKNAFPSITLLKKVAAEFIGTFILIFSAAATPIINQKFDGAATLLGNAASAGIAVMVVILSIGHISGAHINPSITIALASIRRFAWTQVPAYIGAQVGGAICASFALKGIYRPFFAGGVTLPATTIRQAFFLEFVITFVLSFVVTAVATDPRAVRELGGVAVGAIVAANILIAGPMTGGSMNPVRTLGPAVATGNYESIWIYIVAPTTGAVIGAAVYAFLKLEEEDTGTNSD